MEQYEKVRSISQCHVTGASPSGGQAAHPPLCLRHSLIIPSAVIPSLSSCSVHYCLYLTERIRLCGAQTCLQFRRLRVSATVCACVHFFHCLLVFACVCTCICAFVYWCMQYMFTMYCMYVFEGACLFEGFKGI